MRRLWGPLGLAALAAWGADPVPVSVRTIDPAVVEQRLERFKRKNAERRAELEAIFAEAGCAGERLTSQPLRNRKQSNVLCTAPGEEAETIVVGAHYDFVDRGDGVVDDWSGAALLPSLYESLGGEKRRHRFVFVAFAGEEEGLAGSRDYIRQLPKEARGEIRAMVNLECLGMAPPVIWASRADKKLASAYVKVAAALKLTPAAVNVDRIGDDDSHPFLDAKIPVITFHSVTEANFRKLHTREDSLNAIDPKQYSDAYRLAALYLAYIDGALD